ncbi:MAG: histidine phosphatase family protein [Actinomycetota bacterium]|nr:histidine phosphatase family protein [Actinomycetota bacterium]
MDGTLYIARHGSTLMNVRDQYSSYSDDPLAPEGLREAEELARELAHVRFDSILCSPARRARETAGAVREAQVGTRPDVETLDLLAEVNFGRFEGLTRREIVTGDLSASFGAWERGEDGGGAEPLPAAAVRATTLLEGIDLGRRTLLVTHGVFARVLLACAVLQMPLSAYRRLRIDNCGCAVVSWSGGMPRLIALRGMRDPGPG